MKSNIIKYLASAALVLGLAASVQAAQIAGTISFNGTVTLNTPSAGTASQVTGWFDNGGANTPQVAATSGDFSAFVVINQFANFQLAPWNFAYAGPLVNFWNVGGFQFQLANSAVAFQGGSPLSVTVQGLGSITGNGFTTTPGTWTFTTSDPPGGAQRTLFSFQAADGAITPDGGTTAILLGAALSGLALLRRKLA